MKTLLAAIAILVTSLLPADAITAADHPNSYYDGSGYTLEAPRQVRQRHARRHSGHYVKRYKAESTESVTPAAVHANAAALIARIRRDKGRDPTGWYRQWCGNYLCRILYGGNCSKSPLNLAMNWKPKGYAVPAGTAGAVAVMTYHVGVFTGATCKGGYMVVSGNHNHVVGEGCYPRRHIVASRWVLPKVATIEKPKTIVLPPVAVASLGPSFPVMLPDYTKDTPPPLMRTEMAQTGPLVASVPANADPVPEPIMSKDRAAIFNRDEKNTYLCEVYKRTPVKRDWTGDFTFKDIKVARESGRTTCEEVIGGMRQKIKSALYIVGKKLDGMGIKWSILSGYRSNERQRIAEGYKARNPCNSYHGGTCATKGYGDGGAVDVTIAGMDWKKAPRAAGDLFAKYGRAVGLVRPMEARDPAHIQLVDVSQGRKRYYARRNHHRRYASAS